MELCEIRTAEQAIDAYVEKFGGWPSFLMVGAADDEIIFEVRHSLRTGREIEARDPGADY